jgi:hypothetical protein
MPLTNQILEQMKVVEASSWHEPFDNSQLITEPFDNIIL